MMWVIQFLLFASCLSSDDAWRAKGQPARHFHVRRLCRVVPLENAAPKQLLNLASLPFICNWVAPMPEVH